MISYKCMLKILQIYHQTGRVPVRIHYSITQFVLKIKRYCFNLASSCKVYFRIVTEACFSISNFIWRRIYPSKGLRINAEGGTALKICTSTYDMKLKP